MNERILLNIIITVSLWVPPIAGFFMFYVWENSFVSGLIAFGGIGLASAVLTATVWDWLPHDWFLDIENGG